MKFSLADQPHGNVIHSYEKGRILIGGEAYNASLVVLADRIIDNWRPQSFEELVAEDFAEIVSLKPDLLLLGTGARQAFPNPELYAGLMTAGIGIEFMTTASACRTYNLLHSEERNVAAALLLPQ